jgi:hypothetical protein
VNVLVEVNAAVRKLAELSSLLDLCKTDILSAGWRFHSVDVGVGVCASMSPFVEATSMCRLRSFDSILLSNSHIE